MKVCLFFSCDHDIRQQTQRLLYGVCECEFVVCTYQVIYFIGCSYVRILVVVEKAFLCFRSVCPSVRPSIHSSVCLSFSQSTTKPTSIIKVYYFFFFFCFCLFICIRSLTRLLFFFACLCFFRGLYMDFITFKSRKNQQAIPNNNNKNKNKKELCSELSFFTVAAATKQRIVLCCVFVSLFVRSFVCRSYVYAVSCKYVWLFMLFLLLLLLCYVVGYGGV